MMNPSRHLESERFNQPSTREQPEHTMNSGALLVGRQGAALELRIPA